MDPLDELGSLQKKKRGQSVCQKCKKQYNNRSIKVKCDNCDAFMGGSYQPKEREKDAQLLTSTIASVRLNAAGVAVRVFVDLKENKVIGSSLSIESSFILGCRGWEKMLKLGSHIWLVCSRRNIHL